MYIFALRIQNFRSFKDMWFFPNKSLNCIIGPNNSGKSTLISALAILLDPKAPSYRDDFITQFDYHNCETSRPIVIDVWLDKHVEENDEIKTRVFDKFSNWILIKDADGHPKIIEPVIAEPLEDAPDTKDAPVLELLRIQFSSTWDESTKSAEHQTSVMNELGEIIEPFTIALRKLIGFNLIPSNRDPLRDISLSKKGIFSHFLDDNSINPHFRKLIEELEKNKTGLLGAAGIKHVVERLKTVVAAQVVGNSGNQDDAVSITFLNSEISKLRAESCFSIKIGSKPSCEGEPEKSIHIPLEYQGDGIQNLFLIITLSEIVKQRAGSDHCIVALEEPEQHLEPSQVKWIYSELCNCFKSNGATGINQIFITSHSSALVGEIQGADSLILMPVEKIASDTNRIVNASYIKPETKKSFERNKEVYSNALLAKYILVVEGASELGFLPVAFRHVSEDASKNPFHLGLEIIDGQDKERALKRAEELLPFNRPVHVLIDHDLPTNKNSKTTKQLLTDSSPKDYYVSCWGESDLVTFSTGVDLEIILVKEVTPEILLEAIKDAYQDPCHDFDKHKWDTECDRISITSLKDKIKVLFPQDSNLQFADTLLKDEEKRAYLFVLLHAPHSCKSVKEMRIIAEYLASKNAIPSSVKKIHNRILSWITNRALISKQDFVVKNTNGN